MENGFAFSGFDSSAIEMGYSQLAHEWLDNMLSGIDNLAELKVVLYIFRHTCGFQEPEDYKHITIDEFMSGRCYADGSRMDNGTGLSEMSVRSGLKKAEGEGYIEVKTNRRDLARIRKSYRLRFQECE